MDSEDISIDLSSSDEISEVETSWYDNGKKNLRREESARMESFILETDDEDEGELSDSGRLTPSIKKAIRRSIFNISQTENSDGSVESDGSESPSPEKSSQPPVKIKNDGSNDVKNVKLPIVSLLDSDDDVQVTNVSESPSTLQNSVFVSSELEESDNYDDSHEAIAIAKNELGATNIDPMVAQKRAMLKCEINKIEKQIENTKIFIKKGNLDILPDKGEKLRVNLSNDKKKLEKLNSELANLPLVDLDNVENESVSVAQRIRNEFTTNEFNPKNLLVPSTDISTNNFGKQALTTFRREQALTVDRLEDLHGSLLSRPADDTRAKDPNGLRAKLMDHQKYALAWLIWREKQKPSGGILADDMGLGKTLTMISLIMANLEQHNDDDDSDDEWIHQERSVKCRGETLVVCPASLIAQWEKEIKDHCKSGRLTVELYHGNNRETKPKRLARNNVVITTYNLLTREYKNHGVIYNIEWKRVILDEAHVVRNYKSQSCESVCNIAARRRWALTGTPIHNKEIDLYAILKFLRCSPFDDLRVWKRWVDNKNSTGHERLAALMKSLMLRRTKQELITSGSLNALPDKTLDIIHVQLDRDERLIYQKILVYSRTLFAQFLSQRAEKEHNFELGAGKFMNNTHYKDTQFNKAQKELLARHADVKQHEILVLLLRLRQVCCHPSLLHSMLDKDDIEIQGFEDGNRNNDLTNSMQNLNLNSNNQSHEDDGGDVGVDEEVIEHLLTSENPVFDRERQSSKLRAILKLVEEILEKHEKVIIVSQWTSNLEIIAENLKFIEGATYKMFTGKVAVKNRQEIVDSFNNKNSDPQILLLSLTAGGVGLNLVGANNLMLVDIHWNPQLESQAQDRIYRFGQKSNVSIYKFICTDTIEERIKNLQDKKLEIASSVLTGTRNNAGSKLTLDDLKSLFSL